MEDEEGNSLQGVAEIIIAKHRNGALDDVRLRFKADFAKFCDLEEDEQFGLSSEAPAQAMTFGSKMNDDFVPGGVTAAPFDLGRNTGFDSEAPF